MFELCRNTVLIDFDWGNVLNVLIMFELCVFGVSKAFMQGAHRASIVCALATL